MTETDCDPYPVVRLENEAEERFFQRLENKKSSRPYQTLRIAPATHPLQFPSPRGNIGLGNLPEDCRSAAANDLGPSAALRLTTRGPSDRLLFPAGLLAHGSPYSPCLPICRR